MVPRDSVDTVHFSHGEQIIEKWSLLNDIIVDVTNRPGYPGSTILDFYMN